MSVLTWLAIEPPLGGIKVIKIDAGDHLSIHVMPATSYGSVNCR
jgi:hypothetical protein